MKEFSETTRMAELCFTDDEFENYEERAAIMQFDGNMSLEEAENRAFLIIMESRTV